MNDRKQTVKNPERTREGLLDAARTVFSSKGFDAARVGEIAKLAGVNKALINYHFGSKSNLFLAVIEDFFHVFLERLNGSILPEDPPVLQLRKFVRTVGGLTCDFPQLPRLLILESTGNELLMNRLPSYLPKVLMLFAGILNRGIQEGVLRPINPFFGYLHLISSLAFYQMSAPMREKVRDRIPIPPESFSESSFLDFVEDQIIRGYTTDPERERSHD